MLLVQQTEGEFRLYVAPGLKYFSSEKTKFRLSMGITIVIFCPGLLSYVLLEGEFIHNCDSCFHIKSILNM